MIRSDDERRTLSKTALALVLVLVLGAVPMSSSADDDEEEIEFDEASIFFELNDTDEDLGLHALIDGEPWKKLRIKDPNGKKLLDIKLKGRLKKQGLTEIFFESAEPNFEDLSPEEFFARFPEGEYEIEGKTLEGDELEAEIWLSHVLAAPAEDVRVNGLDAAEDCDEDSLPVVTPPVVLSWDPVPGAHPELGREDDDVEYVKTQVVVEREEPELLVLSVDLPPDVTSFEIPEDFTDLDSGDGFKFEILRRVANGNQTGIESCF